MDLITSEDGKYEMKINRRMRKTYKGVYFTNIFFLITKSVDVWKEK